MDFGLFSIFAICRCTATLMTVPTTPVTIALGGNAPAALRRAARLGDGWFSSGMPTLEESLALWERGEVLATMCHDFGKVTHTQIDEATGKEILDRGRHQGRRIVEVFVRHADGHIDRYEERARRKLGSNARSSETCAARSCSRPFQR